MSILFEDHHWGGEVEIDITAGKNGLPFLSLIGRRDGEVNTDLSTDSPFEVWAFFKLCDKAKADYEELIGHKLDA